MFIGFSFNNNNLFSRLIAWFTKSNWSHCFIVYSSVGINDFLIIEAAFHGGVKFNLLSKYKLKGIDLELVPVFNYPVDCLLPYIGKNYGWKQILGYIIARLLKLKKNPITDDIVCSELVFMWLSNHPDYEELFKEYSPNDITPEDIYEKLNLGNKILT